MSKEKGQLLLIDAARILQDRQMEFEIVLIGHCGLREHLEMRICSEDLAQRIRIAGWKSTESIKEQMLSSRALVVPSLFEGIPMTIMEALSLGRPVIATRVGGVPELVEHDEGGWLVAPGSAVALADAMEEALKTPVEQLQRMGQRGLETVRASHNATVEVRKLASSFAVSVGPCDGKAAT